MKQKAFELFEKYNLSPKKFLGQNFLIEESILNKIIETADIIEEDIVLEIGPGLGILTIELAQKARKVIAIEKYDDLCEVLQKIINTEKIKNVEIVNADILKYKILVSLTKYKIVANIPYLDAPLVTREQVRRPTDAVLRRLEKLKNWRKTTAKEMGVESDVVLPKVYLNTLSEKPPKNLKELEEALAESPWRFRRYGPQILKILGG